MAVEIVRCSYCHRDKCPADFSVDHAMYNGRHAHCKVCQRFVKQVADYRDGKHKSPPPPHPYMPGAEGIWS